jgi:hypothetical protein
MCKHSRDSTDENIAVRLYGRAVVVNTKYKPIICINPINYKIVLLNIIHPCLCWDGKIFVAAPAALRLNTALSTSRQRISDDIKRPGFVFASRPEKTRTTERWRKPFRKRVVHFVSAPHSSPVPLDPADPEVVRRDRRDDRAVHVLRINVKQHWKRCQTRNIVRRALMHSVFSEEFSSPRAQGVVFSISLSLSFRIHSENRFRMFRICPTLVSLFPRRP